MFRALLSHPQEALHKRHLVYCVRVMSVGCTWCIVTFTVNIHISLSFCQFLFFIEKYFVDTVLAIRKHCTKFPISQCAVGYVVDPGVSPWPHLSLLHQMSSVVSHSWCVLCGLRVPREGWDGIPVLIDVCGYNLVERSVRTGCVGRSEVFGWLRTGAHLLWCGGVLIGIAVSLNVGCFCSVNSVCDRWNWIQTYLANLLKTIYIAWWKYLVQNRLSVEKNNCDQNRLGSQFSNICTDSWRLVGKLLVVSLIWYGMYVRVFARIVTCEICFLLIFVTFTENCNQISHPASH
jgi:hypothetical protein